MNQMDRRLFLAGPHSTRDVASSLHNTSNTNTVQVGLPDSNVRVQVQLHELQNLLVQGQVQVA